eukprot:COSAG06_NODE_1693_length_8701_cov_80.626133_3_plen_160_part_00
MKKAFCFAPRMSPRSGSSRSTNRRLTCCSQPPATAATSKRQDKTRQDKTRQGKTRPDRTDAIFRSRCFLSDMSLSWQMRTTFQQENSPLLRALPPSSPPPAPLRLFPAKKRRLVFSTFPYACPEPVLVKTTVFCIQMTVFAYKWHHSSFRRARHIILMI